MNKDTFVKKYAQKTGQQQKDALVLVDAFLDVLIEGLKENKKVDITKVFKLELKETKARKARNPQTGEEVDVPAGERLSFKAHKHLKEIYKK